MSFFVDDDWVFGFFMFGSSLPGYVEGANHVICRKFPLGFWNGRISVAPGDPINRSKPPPRGSPFVDALRLCIRFCMNPGHILSPCSLWRGSAAFYPRSFMRLFSGFAFRHASAYGSQSGRRSRPARCATDAGCA